MGLAEGAQPTLDPQRIGENPAVQSSVADLEAALEEQLLDVTPAILLHRPLALEGCSP